MGWKVNKVKRPKITNPILIEGLPGIGNVGKVAVDFIISQFGAQKLAEFRSYSLPNSVFVNEDNLIEMPVIDLYYKKRKNKNDILLLAGDIQPINEVSSYEFCEKVLDILQEFKCKEIVTLGGIGLSNVPKKPKVYCTGNTKDMIDGYSKGTGVDKNLYGVVGPIVGVTGLLLGLANKRKIKGIALLSETLGHPMYLGIKGAREILKVLDKKLSLGIDLKELDKDIKEVEEEMIKRTDFSKLPKGMKGVQPGRETDYIG